MVNALMSETFAAEDAKYAYQRAYNSRTGRRTKDELIRRKIEMLEENEKR